MRNGNKENEIADYNNEFKHLIKLLDDEDENIYSSIRERFISYGDDTANYLKQFLNDENILIKKRAGEIITTINFEKIEKRLAEIFRINPADLLERAVFLIALFGYPGLSTVKYKDIIDKMALDITAEISSRKLSLDGSNPVQLLITINHYLFDKLGYKGNTDNYFDPDNSYINKVIDNKTGIPISLSILYLLIAKRLKIPLYGINLPGHFILKYENNSTEYFIDPYNKGVVISKKEATEFLSGLGVNPDDFEKIPYLKKSEDKEIILRVLRNLSEIYKKQDNVLKSQQIEKLMLCLA